MGRVELRVLNEVVRLPLLLSLETRRLQRGTLDPLIGPERKARQPSSVTLLPHKLHEFVPSINPESLGVSELTTLNLMVLFKWKVALEVPRLGVPSADGTIGHCGFNDCLEFVAFR